jgi:cytoskeletal protein CcmA (bactofilin family)
MFGKSESHLHVGATTLISKLTEMTGDLHFSGNLEIEGTFHGNVIAKDGSNASLRVLHDGKVHGKIHVPIVIINGHVEGEIHSSKHLELAAKATVKGNLHYQFLEVVKGAQVNGKMVHIAPGTATKENPAA